MATNPGAKIETFIWEGTTRTGRTVKGEMEGTSLAFINATLRRRGIKPEKVKRKPKSLLRFASKITMKDITFSTRQIATMINAGIPLAQSLHAISRGHESPRMRELLNGIRQEVESGTNFSVSLRRYPQYFNRLYTGLVAVGEESGTLDVLMEKIALYLEKIEILKGKIKKAMFYPSIIVLVAIVVVSILLLYVIPVFDDLFKDFGAQLPTLTRHVVDFSHWFQRMWWLFFIALFGLIFFSILFYKRSPKFQFIVDRILLRFPVLGIVFRKATIARYSRTLSTMFGAGVPLVDSLEGVAEATGNRVYQNAVYEIRDEVSTGTSLTESMEQTRLFPSMVLQMVETGEESGELEKMLDKISDFYEREVDDAVDSLASLLEPLILIFLGVVVGTIVIAMYLPIFKLAAVF